VRPRVGLIAVAFGVSALASVGVGIVYWRGGQPQLEGVGLGVALGGICVGVVAWAKRLMPRGPFEQPRDVLPRQAAERPHAEASFEEGVQAIGRRAFLGRLFAAALGALGLAAIFPIRSLGERPGTSLFHTSWRAGSRVVTEHGAPVKPSDLLVDGILTVFPGEAVGSADSQTLLIHLPPGTYRPLTGREGWAPGDVVAFSKVCTHAGCPVGLYRADAKELFCPCHQSVFEVLQAATPSEGPATRPLPQLPLDVDAQGYLTARGDFPEPVGPGFWNRDRRLG